MGVQEKDGELRLLHHELQQEREQGARTQQSSKDLLERSQVELVKLTEALLDGAAPQAVALPPALPEGGRRMEERANRKFYSVLKKVVDKNQAVTAGDMGGQHELAWQQRAEALQRELEQQTELYEAVLHELQQAHLARLQAEVERLQCALQASQATAQHSHQQVGVLQHQAAG
ncbi:hypothetical protein HaLaN_26184 [Haematococcus lacustris]|uniref:Uncharacterized protein n=1 Tax=Haematococcus lacustris TaxID=44745 RepID=A0A6A0A5T9_HAELA|nr:hypothetical protein HaLaN_26184 [Haematococcus lacustris]